MNDEANPYLAAARDWLAQDPDPQTRAELTELLDRAADVGDAAATARAELADRFGSRLAFGTAGLRGKLGAGSNRMNRVLVVQAAAGLAAYLIERAAAHAQGHPEERRGAPVVVIGYDGRRNSAVFAQDSAEILAGAGLRVILLPRLLPTPVLAFAVRHLGADAGVMVTASHNPPDDNGYKVYLGGDDAGSQIVAPADAQIAAHIAQVADSIPVPRIPRSVGYAIAPESVIDAYVEATARVAPAPAGSLGMSWVYTALHGVGWETFAQVLDAADYPRPEIVGEQIDPDATFATVAFPNPEEPGAMDLAYAAARVHNAELVIAHDPDADRLAVAVPADVNGGWRTLSGNEVGLLLGWRGARKARAEGLTDASLACSLVSSPGLRVIAGHYGLEFHETLAGFKWISRAPGIVFGFEEALGYLVNPETIRDKDGISAAIALLGIAADARAEGSSLSGLLEELGTTFGHFASAQVSLRVDDVGVIARIMAALRAEPLRKLAGIDVVRADDLMDPNGELPPSDVLRLTLGDGSRVIVRPSGTEPKLKVYIDVRGESAADAAQTITTLETAVREVLGRTA